MPRIPDSMIERLKREVSLERLAADAGVVLKRRGKDWVGHCPFHDDKTPSLIVTPAKNLFHCMGCGAAGSPIDWVMRIEKLEFRPAAEALVKAHFPLAASERAACPERTAASGRESKRLRKKMLDTRSGPKVLLREVIDYYHRTAKAAKTFWDYLTKRGLADEAMVDHFKLGYVDRSLSSVLPSPDSKQGTTARARLRETGITRESGHEHFLSCLVVPIFDASGEIAEVYGRRIAGRQRKNIAQHLYLPGPHRGVWNLEGLEGQKEIILCEALLDALTFWKHGFRNVTASYGVRGFTDEHLETFKKFSIQKVLIAYDRDKPGDDAAHALGERLAAEGIAAYRVQFPKGMDANSFALKVTPAAKSLKLLLEKALPLGEAKQPVHVLESEPKQEPVKSKSTPDKRELAKKDKLAKVEMSDKGESLPAESKQESVPSDSLAKKQLKESTSASVAGCDSRENALANRTNPFEVREEGEDIHATRGDRSYRVRGLTANTNANVMKVNILATRGQGFHVDVLNLYSGYQRANFAKLAARELGIKTTVLEKDLGRLLLKLETLQAQRLKELAQPNATVALSEAEIQEAVTFLRDPKLLDRILEDFRTCGMIGEETNKLVSYLVATSRKLDQPLGALIQSASASGKSTAMDAVLAFIPDEDKVKYSAITGQSLYYMGEEDLKHKVLAIVEEAGAEKASYPLKLLLSEGELTIASTGKNEQTGQHATQTYKVKGPVAVMLTTTAVDTDEEFQNRCLVLAVDETRDQTRAIHQLQRQRRTLEGLRTRHRQDAIIQRQQNAQRMLRPLHVVNPFAETLTFLDTQTRMRRDHQKYLNLIDCIALLHQYQRPLKTVRLGEEELCYVEATREDVAIANHLAAEVLGRTLDELSPQTRVLLLQLHAMVKELAAKEGVNREDLHFTRRQVRAFTGWSETQVRTHLDRLQTMEYVLAHRGMRGQSYVYELVYDGEGHDGNPFLMGLLNVETLNPTVQPAEFGGQKAQFAGPSRPHRGGFAAGSQPQKTDPNHHEPKGLNESNLQVSQKMHVRHGNG